jgi:hypothetical protein
MALGSRTRTSVKTSNGRRYDRRVPEAHSSQPRRSSWPTETLERVHS